MYGGSITFNGINDTQLIDILQTRDKHTPGIQFDIATAKQTTSGNPARVSYSGATVHWTNDAGLTVVHDLIARLLKQGG